MGFFHPVGEPFQIFSLPPFYAEFDIFVPCRFLKQLENNYFYKTSSIDKPKA